MRPLPSRPARTERLLLQSARALNPSETAQERVKQRMLQRMSAMKQAQSVSVIHLLEAARDAVEPRPTLSRQLWLRVQRNLQPASTIGFWEAVKQRLQPKANTASSVWSRILPRLESEPAGSAFHPMKWAAAFAVIAVVVRLSPMLVLAPQSIAESPITATRTRGVASVLVGGLWQPITGELRLEKATQLSTEEGELTVVLHDDAVIRLAPHTVITLNDVADRPSNATGEPTVTLQNGEIWMMGFAPKPLRPLSVATAQGWVTMQEGSLSIRQESRNVVVVRSWDRSSTITRRGIGVSVLSGEELVLQKDGSLTPQRMETGRYEDQWVTNNIARDAAHQRELAQLQRERRAASAGILPDSRLYPVKRLAETVDVLLTFGAEAKTRKVLDHANTRLSEAAALISSGTGSSQAQAQTALQEFRDTVLSVATGSGDTVVSELLESTVVAQATADTSAALPDSDEYLLKQAVRETIASLPDNVEKPDVAAAAVLDEVTLAKRRAEEGDVVLAQAKLEEVRESLGAATGSSALLTPEVREELEATIAAVQTVVEERRPDRLPDASAALTRRADPLLPSQVAVAPLTDEEVEQRVQRIRGQIFVFELRRSQLNELREQISSLDRHPDKGRILRRLYEVLGPGNALSQEVRRQIGNLEAMNRQLQEQLEAQTQTGSGL